MTEWQPIETAPRDGSIIHLWCEDAYWPTPAKWVDYDEEGRAEIGEPGFWEYAERTLADFGDPVEDVTHWMPLPAPPEI